VFKQISSSFRKAFTRRKSNGKHRTGSFDAESLGGGIPASDVTAAMTSCVTSSPGSPLLSCHGSTPCSPQPGPKRLSGLSGSQTPWVSCSVSLFWGEGKGRGQKNPPTRSWLKSRAQILKKIYGGPFVTAVGQWVVVWVWKEHPFPPGHWA